MGLSLIAGPANAGKVALLLERYLARCSTREPVLIVPNRSDVERVERDLLARSGALLGGSIGTFDDVFERIAYAGGRPRSLLGDAQRTLLVRRIVGGASLNGLGRSARFAGFADSLAATFAELESGLLDPSAIEGDLARLYAAYRAELDRLGRWDRDALRRHAVDRLQSDFDAWSGEPVFAYGFEDLTGAEWELLRALAGRTDVTVSLPYEAGRDRVRVAAADDGRPERARGRADRSAAARASTTSRIRRSRTSSARLFVDASAEQAETGGAVRFFEGAGTRADARARRPRDPLARARGHGAGADRDRLPGARALARAARDRRSARSASPSPSRRGRDCRRRRSGARSSACSASAGSAAAGASSTDSCARRTRACTRPKADFLEGRLRGRAINAHDRVEAETLALHGNPFPIVKELREAPTLLDGLRGDGRANAPPRVRPLPPAGQRRRARSTCARTRRCRASRTSSRAGWRSAAR